MSLSNSSLSYFTTKAPLSELGGSSTYHVFDNVIVSKEKRVPQKIENKTAIQDNLEYIIHDNLSCNLLERIKLNYLSFSEYCLTAPNLTKQECTRLDNLCFLYKESLKFSDEFVVKSKLLRDNIIQIENRYQTEPKIMSQGYKMNKSKVRQKMFALFNLKCSRKFIAFYSVSFPVGSSDDACFQCWDYWLSKLRKYFNLTNYVWVSERQGNGTLHFHMLTNNYMPILQINRAMAIIINNQVLAGRMSWGKGGYYERTYNEKGVEFKRTCFSCPSVDSFNGVDVDSIYNSKRHKKTGKLLNQSELRFWLTKYITKYVTKNSAQYDHLCWHCSRSVSMLFTTVLMPLEKEFLITWHLPRIRELYLHVQSDFNSTWLFKFEPPPILYEQLFLYNDLIFAEYEPQKYIPKKVITYKTTKL